MVNGGAPGASVGVMMTDVGAQPDSGGSVDAARCRLPRALRDARGPGPAAARRAGPGRGSGAGGVRRGRMRPGRGCGRPTTRCRTCGARSSTWPGEVCGGGSSHGGRLVARGRDAPSARTACSRPHATARSPTRSRALPRRQRECVVLRYFLDCSTAETADALGVSDGTVKQHLHRALAALGVALGTTRKSTRRRTHEHRRAARRAPRRRRCARRAGGTGTTVQARGTQIRRRRRGAQGAVAIVSVVVIVAGVLAVAGTFDSGTAGAASSRPRRAPCPTRSSPA